MVGGKVGQEGVKRRNPYPGAPRPFSPSGTDEGAVAARPESRIWARSRSGIVHGT